MLATLIIVFREVLEAGLIIGIVLAATEGVAHRGRWIAGGIAKQGGIESLAPYFPRIGFALLIGRDAELLAATLKRDGVPHRVVETMQNAVAAAAALALSEQAPVVLLSPACASFDQYPNFEARGLHFAELVQRRIG